MNNYLPLFPCSQCNTPLDITPEIFIKYLYNADRNCPHCKADNYLWNSTLRSLKDSELLKASRSLVGAKRQPG